MKIVKLICILILISLTLQKITDIPDEIQQKYKKIKEKEKIKKSYYGLRNTQNPDQEIPLKHIDYDVFIENSISTVTVSQVYQNNFDEAIESEFFFAISPEAAFIELSADINGKKVYGVIKEKEQAKQEYDEAIKQGKKAAFAEIVEEVHDIVKLKLGNVEPKETITVNFKYVEPLDIVMNKFYKFSLGNTFESRSLGNRQYSENMQKISNPQFIQENHNQAYTMNVKFKVDGNSFIDFIESPSHDIQFQALNRYGSVYVGGFVKEVETPNKEFVLLYRTKDINKPSYVLGYDEKYDSEKTNLTLPYAARISFFPDFSEEVSNKSAYKKFLERFKENIIGQVSDEDINNQDFDNPVNNEDYLQRDDIKGEYIFIVDRSGSMNGSPMEMTKKALIQALELLPKNSYFNVISFGSGYQQMYQESILNSDSNIVKTQEQIDQFQANLGGTNIFEPILQQMIKTNIDHYSRNIFLLTDGQVHNENSVIQQIRLYSGQQNLRIYSLGIGNGVSKNLIRQAAEEGKGKFEFIFDLNNQSLKDKLLYLIKDSVSPFLEDFQIQYDMDKVQMMVPSVDSIKSVKKNELFTTTIYLPKGFKETTLTLSCYDSVSQKRKSFEISIREDNIQKTQIYHKLGTHKLIKEILNNSIYKQGDNLKGLYFSTQKEPSQVQEIVDLSVQYQVLSEFTAFILVDDESKVENNGKDPLKVEIPIIKQHQFESGGHPQQEQIKRSMPKRSQHAKMQNSQQHFGAQQVDGLNNFGLGAVRNSNFQMDSQELEMEGMEESLIVQKKQEKVNKEKINLNDIKKENQKINQSNEQKKQVLEDENGEQLQKQVQQDQDYQQNQQQNGYEDQNNNSQIIVLVVFVTFGIGLIVSYQIFGNKSQKNKKVQ